MHYEHSEYSLKCNPEKTQVFGGSCSEYRLGTCVKWLVPPQYIDNKPTCVQDDLYTCPSNATFSMDTLTFEKKCTKDTYTCPSGYILSGTKCHGPWSAWSDTPVTPSSTLEVEKRTP